MYSLKIRSLTIGKVTLSQCYCLIYKLLLSNMIATSQIEMWLFKLKLNKLEIQLLSHTSYISSSQQSSGYCIGGQRYIGHFHHCIKVLLYSNVLDVQIVPAFPLMPFITKEKELFQILLNILLFLLWSRIPIAFSCLSLLVSSSLG